ncbi:hypothetical protein ACKWTF_011498 [Chironomus riparius]
MISEKEKAEFEFAPHFVFKEEVSTPNSSRISIKKERTSIPPLLTSYTVPFHFVESGRRNQLLICEGHKYILNNKYGEKSYFKCSCWHSGCKARAITITSQPDCIIRRNEHNHPKQSLKEEQDPIE